MNTQEDYIFWRLAHYLISDQEYRIVQLSKDQQELWLEKRENKQAQIIRLLRYNLDWSNWMQRDIELTAKNGEKIRKQLTRGELNVLNVYVSVYPPVDDYEFRIAEPFVNSGNDKTKVKTVIFYRDNYNSSLRELGLIFNDTPSLNIKDEYQINEIESLKHAALHSAVDQLKSESSFFNYGKPFFTYLFLIAQIVMFLLLEAFGGSTESSNLIKFGAKFNPLILEGEWWRFFTPIVLHIGLLHLLMNSVALFYIGNTVEKIFGNARFLFIYLLAGFSGSLASFLFSPNISAGASGAIFGCFGALLYFGLINPKLFFRTMGTNLLVVIGINLAFGFTMQGIDNAGHIGGLIGGFLAAGITHFPKKKKWVFQIAFTLITTVMIAGALKYGYGNPDKIVNDQAVIVMAQEHIKSDDYQEAYDLLNQYVKEDKNSAEVLFLLSYTEIKLNKVEEADKHLLRVIELKPNFHEAYYNLALLYADKNDVVRSKEFANKALRLKPDRKEYQELVNNLNQLSKLNGFSVLSFKNH